MAGRGRRGFEATGNLSAQYQNETWGRGWLLSGQVLSGGWWSTLVHAEVDDLMMIDRVGVGYEEPVHDDSARPGQAGRAGRQAAGRKAAATRRREEEGKEEEEE